MKGEYIKYCIIGKDTVFSYAPVNIAEDGKFILCDAMYDLADTPYNSEACLLAFPQMAAQCARSGWGEYFNPVTRLYMSYEPGEEGSYPVS